MDRKDKLIILIILLILTPLFYFCNFDYKTDFYSNVITFLSIMIGFTLTSISVLYNTNFRKNFSKMPNKKGTNILCDLGHYYKMHIYFSVLLVVFYMLEDLIIQSNNFLTFISCINIPLLFVNIYITYILVKFFIKLFTNPSYDEEA